MLEINNYLDFSKFEIICILLYKVFIIVFISILNFCIVNLINFI